MRTLRLAPGITSRRTGRRIASSFCGGCGVLLAPDQPMLEIEIGESKRYRCAACAKRMFGEDAPTHIPEDAVAPIPQPSSQSTLTRQSDFVTPAQIARSISTQDFRKRQTGETEE